MQKKKNNLLKFSYFINSFEINKVICLKNKLKKNGCNFCTFISAKNQQLFNFKINEQKNDKNLSIIYFNNKNNMHYNLIYKKILFKFLVFYFFFIKKKNLKMLSKKIIKNNIKRLIIFIILYLKNIFVFSIKQININFILFFYYSSFSINMNQNNFFVLRNLFYIYIFFIERLKHIANLLKTNIIFKKNLDPYNYKNLKFFLNGGVFPLVKYSYKKNKVSLVKKFLNFNNFYFKKINFKKFKLAIIYSNYQKNYIDKFFKFQKFKKEKNFSFLIRKNKKILKKKKKFILNFKEKIIKNLKFGFKKQILKKFNLITHFSQQKYFKFLFFCFLFFKNKKYQKFSHIFNSLKFKDLNAYKKDIKYKEFFYFTFFFNIYFLHNNYIKNLSYLNFLNLNNINFFSFCKKQFNNIFKNFCFINIKKHFLVKNILKKKKKKIIFKNIRLKKNINIKKFLYLKKPEIMHDIPQLRLKKKYLNKYIIQFNNFKYNYYYFFFFFNFLTNIKKQIYLIVKNLFIIKNFIKNLNFSKLKIINKFIYYYLFFIFEQKHYWHNMDFFYLKLRKFIIQKLLIINKSIDINILEEKKQNINNFEKKGFKNGIIKNYLNFFVKKKFNIKRYKRKFINENTSFSFNFFSFSNISQQYLIKNINKKSFEIRQIKRNNFFSFRKKAKKFSKLYKKRRFLNHTKRFSNLNFFFPFRSNVLFYTIFEQNNNKYTDISLKSKNYIFKNTFYFEPKEEKYIKKNKNFSSILKKENIDKQTDTSFLIFEYLRLNYKNTLTKNFCQNFVNDKFALNDKFYNNIYKGVLLNFLNCKIKHFYNKSLNFRKKEFFVFYLFLIKMKNSLLKFLFLLKINKIYGILKSLNLKKLNDFLYLCLYLYYKFKKFIFVKLSMSIFSYLNFLLYINLLKIKFFNFIFFLKKRFFYSYTYKFRNNVNNINNGVKRMLSIYYKSISKKNFFFSDKFKISFFFNNFYKYQSTNNLFFNKNQNFFINNKKISLVKYNEFVENNFYTIFNFYFFFKIYKIYQNLFYYSYKINIKYNKFLKNLFYSIFTLNKSILLNKSRFINIKFTSSLINNLLYFKGKNSVLKNFNKLFHNFPNLGFFSFYNFNIIKNITFFFRDYIQKIFLTKVKRLKIKDFLPVRSFYTLSDFILNKTDNFYIETKEDNLETNLSFAKLIKQENVFNLFQSFLKKKVFSKKKHFFLFRKKNVNLYNFILILFLLKRIEILKILKLIKNFVKKIFKLFYFNNVSFLNNIFNNSEEYFFIIELIKNDLEIFENSNYYVVFKKILKDNLLLFLKYSLLNKCFIYFFFLQLNFKNPLYYQNAFYTSVDFLFYKKIKKKINKKLIFFTKILLNNKFKIHKYFFKNILKKNNNNNKFKKYYKKKILFKIYDLTKKREKKKKIIKKKKKVKNLFFVLKYHKKRLQKKNYFLNLLFFYKNKIFLGKKNFSLIKKKKDKLKFLDFLLRLKKIKYVYLYLKKVYNNFIYESSKFYKFRNKFMIKKAIKNKLYNLILLNKKNFVKIKPNSWFLKKYPKKKKKKLVFYKSKSVKNSKKKRIFEKLYLLKNKIYLKDFNVIYKKYIGWLKNIENLKKYLDNNHFYYDNIKILELIEIKKLQEIILLRKFIKKNQNFLKYEWDSQKKINSNLTRLGLKSFKSKKSYKLFLLKKKIKRCLKKKKFERIKIIKRLRKLLENQKLQLKRKIKKKNSFSFNFLKTKRQSISFPNNNKLLFKNFFYSNYNNFLNKSLFSFFVLKNVFKRKYLKKIKYRIKKLKRSYYFKRIIKNKYIKLVKNLIVKKKKSKFLKNKKIIVKKKKKKKLKSFVLQKKKKKRKRSKRFLRKRPLKLRLYYYYYFKKLIKKNKRNFFSKFFNYFRKKELRFHFKIIKYHRAKRLRYFGKRLRIRRFKKKNGLVKKIYYKRLKTAYKFLRKYVFQKKMKFFLKKLSSVLIKSNKIKKIKKFLNSYKNSKIFYKQSLKKNKKLNYYSKKIQRSFFMLKLNHSLKKNKFLLSHFISFIFFKPLIFLNDLFLFKIKSFKKISFLKIYSIVITMKFFTFKYLILKSFFFNNFLLKKIGFINRYLNFKTQYLKIRKIFPNFYITIKEKKNNIFFNCISIFGHIIYKCTPGMLKFKGGDKINFYSFNVTTFHFFKKIFLFFRNIKNKKLKKTFKRLKKKKKKMVLKKKKKIQNFLFFSKTKFSKKLKNVIFNFLKIYDYKDHLNYIRKKIKKEKLILKKKINFFIKKKKRELKKLRLLRLLKKKKLILKKTIIKNLIKTKILRKKKNKIYRKLRKKKFWKRLKLEKRLLYKKKSKIKYLKKIKKKNKNFFWKFRKKRLSLYIKKLKFFYYPSQQNYFKKNFKIILKPFFVFYKGLSLKYIYKFEKNIRKLLKKKRKKLFLGKLNYSKNPFTLIKFAKSARK